MLKNYTKTSAAKLIKLQITDIVEPVHIKIYWLNVFSLRYKTDFTMQKLHKHSFYEAHFTLNGTTDYIDEDGSVFRISEGNGIIFAPHTKHFARNMGQNTLRFSLAFLPEDTNMLNTLLSKKSMYCFSLSPRLCESIDVILYETEQKSLLSPTLIKNRIFEIICEIARTEGIDKYYADSPNGFSENLVIQKAKQYISDNKRKMLDCTEVAAYCHFNAKYLSRIFAKQTGQTLLDYIHSEKIKYAEELLHDQNLSLKQVSELLGFTNEYYFNSFFKRRNGITPGQFRRLLGN